MPDSKSFINAERAIHSQGCEEVRRLIGETPEQITRIAEVDGGTLLHRACLWKNRRAALELIHLGADVNAQTQAGWTPLHFALWEERCALMVEMLVTNGADTSIASYEGETPLMMTAPGRDRFSRFCADLLIDLGSPLDMYSAVWLNLTSKVAALLSKGDAKATAYRPDDLLQIAVYNGNVALADLLIDHGIRGDVPSFNGMNAVFTAIDFENVEMLKLLLDRECPTDVVNGESALQFAQRRRASPEVISLLSAPNGK